MESSCLKVLLDSISEFKILSSQNVGRWELVQKYCKEINEILKFFKPVLDEIYVHKIALVEQLIKLLEEVNASIDEASGLAGSWHQMTSKVYFVLQVESMATKIQGSVLESCSLLSSQFQSLEDNSGLECVQQSVQKIQSIIFTRTSDAIQEAMRDQIGKRLPASQCVEKIKGSLSLSTNQELLVEGVALDKLKTKFGHGENHGEVEYIDHMIALITYMHECHVENYQVHSINNVPIPADFCCPLSLELMSDPVIVASGQTYERAFIRKWLDQGFTVCPKTRQALAHSNLIPNYTVKALIENWCDTHKIKLSDPSKSMNIGHMSNLLAQENHGTSASSGLVGTSHPRSPEPDRSLIHRNPATSEGSCQEAHTNEKASLHQSSTSVGSPLLDGNGSLEDASRSSLTSSDGDGPSEKQDGYSGGETTGQSSHSTLPGHDLLQGLNRSASASDAVSSNDHLQGGDRNINRAYNNNTGVSGKVKEGASSPFIIPDFPLRLGEARSRSQTAWRRPSDRFSPKILSSSSSLETRPDLSGVETEVRKLIEDLKTDSIDVQRDTTAQLRLLAKHSVGNRTVIANCGAIEVLVSFLHSPDHKTQENAVTTLLNLSINDNNKTEIAKANCIDPLIHVLRTGNAEAKENAAATFFSLSVIEENKIKIGRSGAIEPLVELLGSGTPRGKKDAATALFNLSIFHENKARIVHAGAVKHLVELMDPAAGMVDKAVAVLANLSTIPDGRSAIGHEGGIPILVEVVELGTPRGKENAAAALLQLCTNSNKFCSIVLQECAVPPLVALSRTGTSRAKEKAQALLSHFRNQRHGSAGRA